MTEEFDESDIIFSDNYFPILRSENINDEKENRPVGFRDSSDRVRSKSRRSRTTTPFPSAAAFSTSLPVNIPGNMMRRCTEEEYSDDGGGRKMTPPHLIMGRRMEGGQMAFSVCTGNGRTLKGRDLSRVRNSVLRLTGFLEA